MSTTRAQPMAEAAGAPTARRRYVPVVGPRLKKLLAVVFALFAVLVVNSVYLVTVTVAGPQYQNYTYQWMFLLHLVLGLLIVLPVIVFGIFHIRNARNRPNKRAIRAGYALLRRAGAAGHRVPPHARRSPRRVAPGEGPRGAVGGLLDPRPEPAGGDLALRAAPIGWTAAPLEGRSHLGGRGCGLRGDHARAADAGSPRVGCSRSGQRRTVFLPVARPDLQRQLHPRLRAQERRVLPGVPCRRPSPLVQQRAPVQLVQQPALPLQREADARGADGARRQCAGIPVLRRMSRSGALLQRRRSTIPASTIRRSICVRILRRRRA